MSDVHEQALSPGIDTAERLVIPELDIELLSHAARPSDLLDTADTFSRQSVAEIDTNLASACAMGRLALSHDARLARHYYTAYKLAARLALERGAERLEEYLKQEAE